MLSPAHLSYEVSVLTRLSEWAGVSQIGKHLRALKDRRNILLIAPRLLRVEGVHSDILAWLLDPGGWHGLGDGFVTRFIDAVIESTGEPAGGGVVVRAVYREFDTGNGPVDLLIEGTLGNRTIRVAIENKIDSPESSEQTCRYGCALARSDTSTQALVVLLSLKGHAPKPKCPCVPSGALSYNAVARALGEALDAVSESERQQPGYVFATHYLDALKSHIMANTNSDIDELCRELYMQHQDAWRAIRRRLPSRRDEHHALVGASVCERLKETHGGQWDWVVRRNRYVCIFRPEWLALGHYESDEIVGVNDLLPKCYPKVHFRMVVDADEADADERFKYAVRLKVRAGENSTLGAALIKALKREHPKVQDKKKLEFTIHVKSTTSLPACGEDSARVPDRVVGWFVDRAASLIPVIDGVFIAATSTRNDLDA